MSAAPEAGEAKLRRRLGPFDATMIVMGGIVGSGIFINPYVVAKAVHTPFLILGAWSAGGVLAMLGAFIWAELATRLPEAGGQYLYLREAYHPMVAFVYGWVLRSPSPSRITIGRSPDSAAAMAQSRRRRCSR